MLMGGPFCGREDTPTGENPVQSHLAQGNRHAGSSLDIRIGHLRGPSRRATTSRVDARVPAEKPRENGGRTCGCYPVGYPLTRS